MLIKPQQLDSIFQALGDRNRRYIVQLLATGATSVSELGNRLPITLPAVMQHLDVLEKSGLVQSQKAGRVRTCRLNPEPFGVVTTWIARQQRSLRRQASDR